MLKKQKNFSFILLVLILISSLIDPLNIIARELVENKEDKDLINMEEDLNLKDAEEDHDFDEFDKEVETQELDRKNEEVINRKGAEDNIKESTIEESAEEKNIYVDINNQAQGDGSKENPFKSMDDALNQANSQQEKAVIINVKKGEYFLNPSKMGDGMTVHFLGNMKIIGDEDVVFYIKNKVQIGESKLLDNKEKEELLFENIKFKLEIFHLNVDKINLKMNNVKIVDKIDIYDHLFLEVKANDSDISIYSSDIEANLLDMDNSYISVEDSIFYTMYIESKNSSSIYIKNSRLETFGLNPKDSDIRLENIYMKDENLDYVNPLSIKSERSNIEIESSDMRFEELDVAGGELKINKSNIDIGDSADPIFLNISLKENVRGRIEDSNLNNIDVLSVQSDSHLDLIDNNLKKDLYLMIINGQLNFKNSDENLYQEVGLYYLDVMNSDIELKNVKNIQKLDLYNSQANLNNIKSEEIIAKISDEMDYKFLMKDSEVESYGRTSFLDIIGYDELVIDGLLYREAKGGINIEMKGGSRELNINNLLVENIENEKTLINIFNAKEASLNNIRLKNNMNSLINIENSNYYIEDVKFICDNESLFKDSPIFNYGLRVDSLKNDKTEGYVRQLDADLNMNETKNIFHLDLLGVNQYIDRLNTECSSIDLNIVDSYLSLTNSKVGDYRHLADELDVYFKNANLELINNTIVNYKIKNFIEDGYSDKSKINNNILDISGMDKYMDFINHIDLNNNILLNIDISILQDGNEGNIGIKNYKDIGFISDKNLRLTGSSTAINNGNSEYLNIDIYGVDLDNKDRLIEEQIDIGAYEYQGEKIKEEVNYIVGYIDEEGKNLIDPIVKIGKENDKIIEIAKDIKSYELVGDREQSLVLKYGEENKIVFKYKKIEKPTQPPVNPPIDPEEPEKPETPEEPEIPQEPEEPEIPEKPILNKKNHFAYIAGYEDGSVGPDNKMVREEVAAVFFRLLDPEYRDSIRKDSHDFPDFSKDKWSAKHIGSLANAGIVSGNERGEFLPDNVISRAEVASIAARFADENPKTDKKSVDFTDIKGHWAEDHIRIAADLGWIVGYEDGSFRPNEKISRAEFISLVNGVLDRKVNKENILEGIKDFTDIDKKAWYYEALVEATNGHVYNEERLEDGSEEWLELKDFNVEM